MPITLLKSWWRKHQLEREKKREEEIVEFLRQREEAGARFKDILEGAMRFAGNPQSIAFTAYPVHPESMEPFRLSLVKTGFDKSFSWQIFINLDLTEAHGRQVWIKYFSPDDKQLFRRLPPNTGRFFSLRDAQYWVEREMIPRVFIPAIFEEKAEKACAS